MSTYQKRSDRLLFKQYLTMTNPNYNSTELDMVLDQLFAHDRNIMNLLTNSTRDYLLDQKSKKLWCLIRAIYKRSNQEATSNLTHIKNLKNLDTYLFQHFHMLTHEEVFVIAINHNNDIIDEITINIGNTLTTIIDSKRIAKWALLNNADGIILAHNHPNGTVEPSLSDVNTSIQLSKSLSLIDVNLLDSIIIKDNEKYSLAKEKIIK